MCKEERGREWERGRVQRGGEARRGRGKGGERGEKGRTNCCTHEWPVGNKYGHLNWIGFLFGGVNEVVNISGKNQKLFLYCFLIIIFIKFLSFHSFHLLPLPVEIFRIHFQYCDMEQYSRVVVKWILRVKHCVQKKTNRGDIYCFPYSSSNVSFNKLCQWNRKICGIKASYVYNKWWCRIVEVDVNRKRNCKCN